MKYAQNTITGGGTMRWGSGSVCVWLVMVLAGCADGPEPSATPRQQAVAEAGRTVMPFDLERTTHVFEKLAAGGRQQVVADEPDPEQVGLIREHLMEEAQRFSRGDFRDPGAIHGESMPGLHALVDGFERLSIQFSEVAGGGEIRYSSEDPVLVEAIHAWFDAQVSDHGAHAQAGH